MRKLIKLIFLSAVLLISGFGAQCQKSSDIKTFDADHKFIRYTGRVDFSDPKSPRFWAPGVYLETKFKGPYCEILLDEEMTRNYLHVIIDDSVEMRIRTSGTENSLVLTDDLSEGTHSLLICKDTESNNGYIEFRGIRCQSLAKPDRESSRKIEFIGNSITSGTGSDMSEIDCGKGYWHDQHNAYMSYGAVTARNLFSEWNLSSYSGIGLIRSCCDIPYTMPDIYDKVVFTKDSIEWDFSRYQPDVVTICLGQNDGIQDSTDFTSAYINFIRRLRFHHPDAKLVCLTSPMADDQLRAVLENYITGVVDYINRTDQEVYKYFFSRGYNSGCDNHPSLAEHQLIAEELTEYLGKLMRWY